MDTSSPDPLQRLLAAEQIRQLAYRYAYAVDSRDAELMHSLWAEPDGVAEYPDIDLNTVRRDHERWFSKGPTVHFVGNHLIDLDDADHAHGSVYCWAQLDLGERFVDQSILYQDRYVRQPDGWCFLVRRHLLWFGQARERNPIDQEPDGWPRVHYGRGSLPRDLMPPERAQRYLLR
ncbi:MAG: nuclear transport factor 2 family protein [Solirubrobacteraceae bacterium]